MDPQSGASSLHCDQYYARLHLFICRIRKTLPKTCCLWHTPAATHTALQTVLFIAIFLVKAAATEARAYYIAPSGNDSNSGFTAQEPKKSFSEYFGVGTNSAGQRKPVLNAGDSLILQDGVYTDASHGPGPTALIEINCQSGAALSGTATQPITIQAAHERSADLRIIASVRNVMRISGCSHYRVIGLTGRNADIDGAPAYLGAIFEAVQSDHVIFRRCLGVHPNRVFSSGATLTGLAPGTRNVHVFAMTETTHSLYEENEAYDYVRHAFNAFKSRYITMRRNYANGRSAVPKSSDGMVLYGTSDSIIENCVTENNGGQFSIIGIEAPSAIDASGRGGQRNRILGSIAHNAGGGSFKIASRYVGGAYRNARDNTLEHIVAAKNATGHGVFLRASAANMVRHATLYGNAFDGLSADDDGGVPSAFSGTCGMENAEGCGFTAQSMLSFNNASAGARSVAQRSCAMQSFAASGNFVDFAGQAEPGAAGGCSRAGAVIVHPDGMGLGAGQCLLWTPDASSMKGAGAEHEDRGATILYRYEDGALTSWPLWAGSASNVCKSGGCFLGCGALVPGINDDPARSCIGLQARLNIGHNGCLFPGGYAGWEEGAQATAPQQRYVMYRTGSAPVIDGNPEEFAQASSIMLTNAKGTAGTYRLLWDSAAIYVAAQVRDADLRTATGEFWNEDGVELFFDAQNNGGTTLGRYARKVHINAANRQGGTLPIFSAVHLQGTLNDAGADAGYVIEAAIPWSSLGGAVPADEAMWGFELSLNDRAITASSQTAWANTTGGGFNDPEGWGQSVFSSTVVNEAPADTTPPAVTLISPTAGGVISGQAITVTAAASDNIAVTKIQFMLDGTIVAEDASSPYEAVVPAGAGAHTLGVVAWDAAGLSARSPAVDVLIDNRPPALSNGAPRGVLPSSQTSVVLSLETDEDASCRYGRQGEGVIMPPYGFTTTGGRHHAVTVADLAAGKTYAYSVRCEDKASPANATQSDYVIAFETASPDIMPPTGTMRIGAAEQINTPQVTLLLTAADNSGAVAQMRFSSDGIVFSAPEPYGPQKTWTLTGGDGLKTVAVQFFDAAGNGSAAIRDTVLLDTAAPAPYGLRVQMADAATAHVAWNTLEPATAQVAYGRTAAYEHTSPTITTPAINHVVTLSDLAANTTYFYRAASQDEAGNVGMAVGSFRTPAMNLAPNPGIEMNPETDYFTHGTAAFSWANDAAHSGRQSLKISSPQKSGRLARWMTRNNRMAAVGGKTYEATVWVKTTAGADARAALSFWDGTAWNVVGAVSESAPQMPTATSGWRPISVRGVAPSAARYMRLEARLYGPGTLWVDDVTVIEFSR